MAEELMKAALLIELLQPKKSRHVPEPYSCSSLGASQSQKSDEAPERGCNLRLVIPEGPMAVSNIR